MVILEWYRSFVVVYRCGTISAATESLHITQPAVSQHISSLEKVLKGRLFHRTPRRMVPTELGKSLYSKVAPAIESLEATAYTISSGKLTRTLRLGAPAEAFYSRAVGNLNKLDQFNLHFTFDITIKLIEQLEKGELDAVIATQKITRAAIDYQKIFEESFLIVGPADCAKMRQGHKSLDLLCAELAKSPWISYGEDLPIIRRFWRQVFGKRADLHPKMIIPDLRAILQTVEAGLGFSVLPDYLCRDSLNRKNISLILKPAVPVTNEIWLAYRKSERLTDHIAALIGAFPMSGALKKTR